MTININAVSQQSLKKLRETIIKLREDGAKIEDLVDEMEIDGAMAILHHLKYGNQYLNDALNEAKLLKDATPSQHFELRMNTIAKLDQLDLLLEKGKPRIWGEAKHFTQHMYSTYGIPDDNTKIVLKNAYNRYKRRINEKLARIKTNKDVLALAQKHPDIDIRRLVSYGVVSENMDYTKEQLAWLDKMIEIIKQGNKQ